MEPVSTVKSNLTSLARLRHRGTVHPSSPDHTLILGPSFLRLEGSVGRFRKMDMTIGEREMKIAELEAQ